MSCRKPYCWLQSFQMQIVRGRRRIEYKEARDVPDRSFEIVMHLHWLASVAHSVGEPWL